MGRRATGRRPGHLAGAARQLECARLLLEGHEVKEIARKLGVSERTVRRFRDSDTGKRIIEQLEQQSILSAKRVLTGRATRAAQYLGQVVQLGHGNKVVVSAATAILDRVGLGPVRHEGSRGSGTWEEFLARLTGTDDGDRDGAGSAGA